MSRNVRRNEQFIHIAISNQCLKCWSIFEGHNRARGKNGAHFLFTHVNKFQLLESENLPDKICDRCRDKVFISFELVQLCVGSERTLRNQNARNTVLKQTGGEEVIAQSLENSALEYTEDKDCNISVTDEATSESSACSRDIKIEFTKGHNSDDKYYCEECMLSYRNKNTFQRHIKTHDKSKQWKCEHCQQRFAKQLHLNVHLRTHIRKEDKEFVCSTCGEQFTYEYLLKQHFYKHTDKKPFPCDKCQKGKSYEFKKKQNKKSYKNNFQTKMSTLILFQHRFTSFFAMQLLTKKNHLSMEGYVAS